jgi:putative transport protein
MTALMQSSYFVLFLVVALGILLGHVRIRGISLDVSAVIFVALIFGHYGYRVPADFQNIGLLLFIFTIGIAAGPGFFESFQRRGFQLILTTVVIVVTGAGVTVALAYLFKVDFKMASGLFTGALTSTPGLAAAIEAARSPLASIGYGVAYPFGVLGVILFVRVMPRLLRADLVQAVRDYAAEAFVANPEILNRNFIVENANIDNQPIGALAIRDMTGATISRVMHDGTAVTPSPQTQLHLGDLVKAVGTEEALEKTRLLIGPETSAEIPLSKGYDVQWVLVTNKEVVNQSLAALHLHTNYNANITRIRRSDIDIAPRRGSILRFGDKLLVACDSENMSAVIKLLGNDDKRLSETDFLPITLGIVAGVLLGRVHIPLPGGMDFSLGLTGGVLAAALLLSRIGKTGPIIWSLSGTANQVLRQLGLLFFLAAVGTEAGAHIAEAVSRYGATIFLIGAAITLLPMIIGMAIGYGLFRGNILTILGTMTGAMTSTPGLGALDTMSDCNAASVAYATVYPVALVCTIICAQIISVL